MLLLLSYVVECSIKYESTLGVNVQGFPSLSCPVFLYMFFLHFSDFVDVFYRCVVNGLLIVF